MVDGPGTPVQGEDVVARSLLLLQAAETINSSLGSGDLERTILGEAVRLTGAAGGVLLVARGDVLVAQEALGMDDRERGTFVVPLETSLYGRALVSGDVVLGAFPGEAGAASWSAGPAASPARASWRAVMVAPLRHHREASRALALFFTEPPQLDEGIRATLRTLAIHAAIALDNHRLMEEKERMAVRDGLTDVFNRGYLELALERAVKEARRSGGEVSVLFVDVDGMKDVNDTYGHRAGDALLVDLGRLLSGSCRETDIVARYGGDEFVVLMPGTGAAGAAEVERKVAQAIADHASDAAEPRLSASLGTYTATAEGVPTLLQEADRRMYAVKRARGRGRAGGDQPAV